MQWIAFIALALSLTADQQEQFLKTAKALRIKAAGSGVTNSKRVTFSDGRMQHDAHVQSIDSFKFHADLGRRSELGFRDSWRYNLAAYRLSQMLGLNMIPVTVERQVERHSSSVTWWLDDVLMNEASRIRQGIRPAQPDNWARQLKTVWLFDQLIANTDRNLGNLLITKDWNLWMIDHSRAFRQNRELRHPERITSCDRAVLERLRALDKPTVKQELGRYLDSIGIAALLMRRDEIVRLLDERRQHQGDAKVLFDLPAR